MSHITHGNSFAPSLGVRTALVLEPDDFFIPGVGSHLGSAMPAAAGRRPDPSLQGARPCKSAAGVFTLTVLASLVSNFPRWPLVPCLCTLA